MNNQTKSDQPWAGKTLITIGITLVLVAVTGGFWYATNKQEKPKPKKTLEDIRRESNESIVEVEDVENIEELVDGIYQFEDVDTSDWQTYRNEDLGIEMKIPGDWFCEEDKFVPNNPPNSRYSRACMNESVREEYDGWEAISDTIVVRFRKDDIMDADVESKIRSYRSPFEQESKLYIITIDQDKEILIDKGNSLSIINRRGKDNLTLHYYKKTPNSKKTFDGIISTFKFLD